MVRATRSSAAQQEKAAKDKPAPVPSRSKSTKKRKRVSLQDGDDHPPTKHLRADDDEVPVKDEETADALPDVQSVGDQRLVQEVAQKILDILEMIDNQGLLDRVFPLSGDSAARTASSGASTSKLGSDSISLRDLLKSSQDHTLRTLRSAVQQLFPISAQPRSRTSPPGAQQLRFCQLALALIDQASAHAIDLTSIEWEPPATISKDEAPEWDGLPKRRKYALVQNLPGGEWWTSLNSESASIASEGLDLKDLGTGYGELVSILPSPSGPPKFQPTLGDLCSDRKISGKIKVPGPRQISCGSFLDYGPYASFAPRFDGDGSEIGLQGVSTVLWSKQVTMREKARRLKAKLLAQQPESDNKMVVDEVVQTDLLGNKDPNKTGEHSDKIRELMKCLMTPEEARLFEPSLEALELEENVSELLYRNASALLRLEELQNQRLGGKGPTKVDPKSEEWETAQKILESLTLLASLRPRSSTGCQPALVPPKSVLRALHRTLPVNSTVGWHGTLSDSRPTSMRDDATLHIKPGATTVPKPTPAAPTTATPTATPTTFTPGQAYNPQNFSYSSFTPQFRSTYTYAPGQAASYYTNAYQHPPSTPQNAAVLATQYTPHYSNTAQTHQYPYTGWYANYQPQTPVANSATNSGRATPQPTAPIANTYSSFFASTATQTPTRAVANTVTPKPQVNGWVANGYAGTPTLPPHLRPSAALPSTPGAPSYPSGYYAAGYAPNASTVGRQ